MSTAGPATMEAHAEEFRTAYQRVKAEIAKVIVGHEEIVHGVLTCLFVGGHALLEGVPGLGKTLLVRTLADSLSLDFNRIQFTPDLMPADIIGTNIVMEAPDGRRVFESAPRAALFPDRAGRRDQPSYAQDPVGFARGHAGTLGHRRRTYPQAQRTLLCYGDAEPDRAGGNVPLPEAQLDRFMFKLVVGYSTRDELNVILDRTTRGERPKADSVIDGETLIRMQGLVRQVIIAACPGLCDPPRSGHAP